MKEWCDVTCHEMELQTPKEDYFLIKRTAQCLSQQFDTETAIFHQLMNRCAEAPQEKLHSSSY